MRVRIDDIGHGGVGVGRIDDRVIFVRGAIPGELVDVAITDKRAKFLRGVVRDVIEPSPDRVDHPWPDGQAGRVGAADFGHIRLTGQRELKSAVIKQAVRRIGGEALADMVSGHDLGVRAVDEGDGWHSRTRFDVVKMERGVGMYAEKTNTLVPISSVPLAVRDLEQLDLFGTSWDEAIKPGERIKAVAPASGPNVVVAGGRVWSAPGRDAADHVQERAYTGEEIVDYQVSAAGFWQIHHRAPSALLSEVLRGSDVGPGDHVAELFSGAGLFTVPLARRVGPSGSVRAYEGSARAVADANVNLDGMPWASARQRRIDATIAKELTGADVVVADPPRAGLGAQTADALGALPARKIVLVSCDPAAMARDVAQLVASGREIESIVALDIFPHTHHVEVICVLR
ncbi:class I SAM-dependent RNA methyltransferase [Trueperella bialowiezensis]|uniref:Uncharacterized RNA methyltransferase Cgl1903/cg2084 n=1 Tax=Trueperella bialowiezensis TaxID=312285 RepID=A0A448PC31_9ACTO|nr:TRAM domain-containing protein [Trueperella bialowiezensis]VEI12503.1 Uncharacterized RNA methyltransferase Cgl1903/cg2084 [Trueperella bialowiezensis]